MLAAKPYIPTKTLCREWKTILESCKVSKNSRWHQFLMHASLAFVGWLPGPGLVLLQTVTDTVQHVDHVLSDCREEFVAMERAPYRKVQI